MSIFAYEIHQRGVQRAIVNRSLHWCNDLRDLIREGISIASPRSWDRLSGIGSLIEKEAKNLSHGGLIDNESPPWVCDSMYRLSDDIDNACFRYEKQGAFPTKCPDLGQIRRTVAKVKELLICLDQTIGNEIALWRSKDHRGHGHHARQDVVDHCERARDADDDDEDAVGNE